MKQLYSRKVSNHISFRISKIFHQKKKLAVTGFLNNNRSKKTDEYESGLENDEHKPVRILQQIVVEHKRSHKVALIPCNKVWTQELNTFPTSTFYSLWNNRFFIIQIQWKNLTTIHTQSLKRLQDKNLHRRDLTVKPLFENPNLEMKNKNKRISISLNPWVICEMRRI